MSTDSLPNEPTKHIVENSSPSPDYLDIPTGPKGSAPKITGDAMNPGGAPSEMFQPTWGEASIPPQGPSPSPGSPIIQGPVTPIPPEQPLYDWNQAAPTQQATLWEMQNYQQQPPASWQMQNYPQQPPASWQMQNYPQQPPITGGMPTYPQQPPITGGMPVYPQQPLAPPVPKQPGKLAQPLPLWALISSIALVIVLLIVLHLTGSDWAEGAVHAAFAALAIATILALVLGVRTLNGMSSPLNPTRRKQYLTSILCILVLFAYFGAGLLLQPNLHVAQAHWLEGRQNWQEAVNEYILGGEKAPDAEDLARTYTSWGLALSKAHQYSDAQAKFTAVISQFNTNTEQVQIAKKGDIDARIALGQQKIQAQDYGGATTVFDNALQLAYCDDPCRTQISTLDATAYYNVGESSLQNQAYDAAVSAFDTVLTKFPNAPEASELHGDMARALLGQGQQLRATACSSAIPVYQRLANQYNDTSQGQSAQSDLNAPQDVTGTFENTTPSLNYSQMGLVQGLTVGMPGPDAFNLWDNTPYKSTIQNGGTFVIKAVQKGSYELIWYAEDAAGRHLQFSYTKANQQPTYVAQVGPLCSVDMGRVSNLSSSPQ